MRACYIHSMKMDDPQALLKQLDSQLRILVLVKGRLANGESHYAYASMPPSAYAAFKEAEAAGAYDLADFGDILAHGSGDQPPADVMAQMESSHGADHELESKLQSLLGDIQGRIIATP